MPRPRNPLEAEYIQGSILRACQATSDRHIRDIEFADMMGCDRSEVSRFRSGERMMDIDELVRLIGRFGSPAVLGPLAALSGSRVVSSSSPRAEPITGAVQLVSAASALLTNAHEAAEDGHLSAEERSELARRAREIIHLAERVIAGVSP